MNGNAITGREVADFLNWQCDLVNEYKRKDQFVTHCFMPDFHNIDQVESFRQMQYPAINVYHDVQDKQDGQRIAYAGDFNCAPWPTTITSSWKPTHKASAGMPAPSFLHTTTSCGRIVYAHLCFRSQYGGILALVYPAPWAGDILARRAGP